MTEAERRARVAAALEWTVTHHARNIEKIAEIERRERAMANEQHLAQLDVNTMTYLEDSRPATEAEELAMHERLARASPTLMGLAYQNVRRSEAALEMLLTAMLRATSVHRMGRVTETMMASIETEVRGILFRATGSPRHPAVRIALVDTRLDVGFRFANTDEGRMQRYELGIAVYETLVRGLEGR